MPSPQQRAFLAQAFQAAQDAGHPFAGAAAAESALESSWYTSQSATQHNNLLGIRQPSWRTGPTFTLTTKEQRPDGSWYTDPNALWSAFDSWAECFECQVEILHRNPAYAPALAAKTPEEYIRLESKVWATGLKRGNVVLSIYEQNKDILDGA